MDLKETGSVDVDWIHLARNIFQKQLLVNIHTRFFGYYTYIPLRLPLTYANQPKAPTINVGCDTFISAKIRVYRMATERNIEKYATERING
jgi:hypothetical protein